MSLLLALLLAAAPGRGYAVAHPLPTATVSCRGDSIFAGACGEPICYELGLLLPSGYSETNDAHSGETADQIAHRAIAEAGTTCFGGPCGTYAFNGGVNTLKIADYAEWTDAAVAAMALYGDGAEVLGMMDAVDFIHTAYPHAAVLEAGVLPYAGCDDATCPSKQRPGFRAAAFNAALLDACAARPWLKCVSPYASFEDPDNPDHLNPAISCADGIHLLPGGHAQLASAVHGLRTWP